MTSEAPTVTIPTELYERMKRYIQRNYDIWTHNVSPTGKAYYWDRFKQGECTDGTDELLTVVAAIDLFEA